ncbi:hypothetical protein Pdsh_10290 [Pyrodictium delaneyi]|uniref:Uncharacterized protein n=1 Tax=Pyrodictium delaneyi TaxID=1273541 RepID=A0A211YLW9_9CREN|nr:hypothetical protein Pdsh_10290 [Pyrodictium delaneyi]
MGEYTVPAADAQFLNTAMLVLDNMFYHSASSTTGAEGQITAGLQLPQELALLHSDYSELQGPVLPRIANTCSRRGLYPPPVTLARGLNVSESVTQNMEMDSDKSCGFAL